VERRGRKKEITDGVRTNILFPEETLKSAERRGIRLGQFSEYVRNVVSRSLNSPLDISEDDIQKELQATDIKRADLLRRLDEIKIEKEKLQELNLRKAKEAPVVSIIMTRIRKMIDRKFLGVHLSSVIYELGFVSMARDVGVMEQGWVKPLLPFISKFIIDDVNLELNRGGFEWPRSYSKEEAVRYALTEVCKFNSSVLEPLSLEEKMQVVKKSTLSLFPQISDSDSRGAAISHMNGLLKAYGIERKAGDVIEELYSEKKERTKETSGGRNR
jgi:hypothetical protein